VALVRLVEVAEDLATGVLALRLLVVHDAVRRCTDLEDPDPLRTPFSHTLWSRDGDGLHAVDMKAQV